MAELENSLCSFCGGTELEDAPVFGCGGGHFWCRECIDNMCQDAPHECPWPKCTALLDRSKLQAYVSEENFKSFEEATLRKLESAAPRPGELMKSFQRT